MSDERIDPVQSYAAQQHQRRAHGDAQQHLIGVLQVGHVRRHAGDQPGRAELVDVGKGEGLHVFIDGVAQVAGKAGGGGRGVRAGTDAKHEAQTGEQQDDGAIQQNAPHAARLDATVDDGGGDERDQDFHQHFQRRVQRRQNGIPAVVADVSAEGFEHMHQSFPMAICAGRFKSVQSKACFRFGI